MPDGANLPEARW